MSKPFKPVWYRRPDGVLMAARNPFEDDLFARRQWKHVQPSAAAKEINSGKQAKVTAALHAQSKAVDAAHDRQQAEKKTHARRKAAKKLVDEAQLATSEPKPPKGDADGDKVAAEEKPPGH